MKRDQDITLEERTVLVDSTFSEAVTGALYHRYHFFYYNKVF